MSDQQTPDPYVLDWLASAIEKQNKGSFEGSGEQTVLWKSIAFAEKDTGCDPVRAIRLVNEEEKDMLLISFSYFSIAVLGIFTAIAERNTQYVILVGQEEVITPAHLIPVGEVLLDTLSVLLKRICKYSLSFDERFRDLLNPPEGGTDEPV